MKRILTATALSLAMFSTFTWAADAAPAASAATTAAAGMSAQQVQDVAKVAQQGFTAMRDMQFARVALFRGSPEVATKLTDQAAGLLADDSTDWKAFIKSDKKAPLAGDNYVIINASIALSEDFVATPEKQKAIARPMKTEQGRS